MALSSIFIASVVVRTTTQATVATISVFPHLSRPNLLWYYDCDVLEKRSGPVGGLLELLL